LQQALPARLELVPLVQLGLAPLALVLPPPAQSELVLLVPVPVLAPELVLVLDYLLDPFLNSFIKINNCYAFSHYSTQVSLFQNFFRTKTDVIGSNQVIVHIPLQSGDSKAVARSV
jgi:hypothetical protein